MLIEHGPIAGDLGDFRYFHVYIYIPLCMYIYTLYIYIYALYIMICHRNIHANDTVVVFLTQAILLVAWTSGCCLGKLLKDPTQQVLDVQSLFTYGGFHSLGGTPIAGWFI